MSDALIGWGTTFQTSDGASSPPTWSTVAEVTSITPPSISRDNIDLSHENGPYDWRENMPGMTAAGEIKLEFNFVPGSDAYNDLFDELSDRDIRARRIVFPNGAVLGFSAFLTSLESEAPVDAQIKATATFQLSGQVDPIA
jgi:predicted secreted protein